MIVKSAIGLIAMLALFAGGVAWLVDLELSITEERQALAQEAETHRPVAPAPIEEPVIHAQSPASAGEVLRTVVRDAARLTGLQWQQSDVAYERTHGPYRVIELTADVSGPLRGLLAFMGELERPPSALYVAELSVERRQQNQIEVPPQQSAQIRIQALWQANKQPGEQGLAKP